MVSQMAQALAARGGLGVFARKERFAFREIQRRKAASNATLLSTTFRANGVFEDSSNSSLSTLSMGSILI